MRVLDDTRQDLAYAIRTLAREPGVVAAVATMLALGIGACTIAFSVVDLMMVRPLPYPESDRLVNVYSVVARPGSSSEAMSVADVLDMRSRSRTVDLAARVDSGFTLASGELPERVEGDVVSSNFFEVLGVRAALGRTFLPADELGGGHRVAVISDGLWRRAFGADAGILERDIRLDDELYRVVGVLPRRFWYRHNLNEVWLPLTANGDEPRGDRYVEAVGRLRAGVRARQAAAELEHIAHDLATEHPDTNQGYGAGIRPLRDLVFPVQLRQGGLIALVAVGLVLLIACGNVTNLMLARGSGRASELAIRRALGAGRGRICRQLLTEAAVLASLGGALGLAVTHFGVLGLVELLPDWFPRIDQIGINGRVLLFCLGVTAVTAAMSGVAPALRSSGGEITGPLSAAGRGVVSPEGSRLRHLLVVGEVALALTVCVGCSLLVSGFLRLRSLDYGWSPEGVLTFRISLPDDRYPDDRAEGEFWARLVPALGSVPGVEHVGGGRFLPLMYDPRQSYEIPGEAYPELQDRPVATVRDILPGYFDSLEIPLLRGRSFTAADRIDSPGVAVVNQAFVRRHWPAREPVGRKLRISGMDVQIVGVVRDTLDSGLRPQPTIFVCAYQHPSSAMYLALRTAGPPMSVADDARAVVARLDRRLAIYRVRSMADVMRREQGGMVVMARAMPVLGGIALLLAMGGVYAVMAYSASRRTHEMGLRMALGAQRGDVVRLVVSRGLQLTLVGVALGLAISALVSESLSTFLFGVSPLDPLAFAVGAAVLLSAGAGASYLPARRAALVDPVQALRSE